MQISVISLFMFENENLVFAILGSMNKLCSFSDSQVLIWILQRITFPAHFDFCCNVTFYSTKLSHLFCCFRICVKTLKRLEKISRWITTNRSVTADLYLIRNFYLRIATSYSVLLKPLEFDDCVEKRINWIFDKT